jgi:glycosyltransferase involved in cell wall biosynthesis
LAEDDTLDMNYYFGSSQNGSIKEIDFDEEFWQTREQQLNRVKNRRLFGRVVWQSGVIGRIFRGNINRALFLGDVNIISTWIAATILNIRGARVYFWGHGFTGKESLMVRWIRILFYRLADAHFLYGNRARDLMVKYGFSEKKLYVVYNSLDYNSHLELRDRVDMKEEIQKLFEREGKPLLVFIGRLTAVKRIDLLIKAVAILNRDSQDFNLLIIGDGHLRKDLENLASRLLRPQIYCFYGACYDEKIIGKLLSAADLCVSPGNVGLTAIHCMSFGTPVCTHSNLDYQMPEFEAIEPGKTGFFFEQNNSDDMAEKIKTWFEKPISRDNVRQECYSVIDQKYNPYVQLETFKRGILENG